MKYNAEKMIKQSRFCDLAAALTVEEHAQTVRNINRVC